MDFDVLEEVASTRGFDLRDDNVQILSPRQIREVHRARLFAGGLLPVTPLWPVVVDALADPLASRMLASVLERSYPAGHELLVFTTEDDPPEGGEDRYVEELADLEADVCIAVIPPLPSLDAGRDPRTLQHIVARLRQPDGCPWDRKQTNKTLRDSLIDEVYEAVDAINANDMENLAEELGDLLLLIMMHAQIAEEAGGFTLEDVYEGIATKIVRRHPHVFGDEAAQSAEHVESEIWKRVKADERANGKKGTKAADGQPHSMPALTRAARALHKHPLSPDRPAPDGPGGQLLSLIAGIIDDGDDPDAVLRAALEQHVGATDRDNS